MKEFLNRKKKGYFCSVAALVLTALGLVFFRMLTAVSVEQAERPALVVVFSFAAILFDLIASYKDYGKVPSIAAYALSTLAFFTLLEGRVSYLAFYFSGDVMDTGLSPYMAAAFLCFLAAMVLSLLTVVFEEDKANSCAFSQADLKVILPMALVSAILCAIVVANMNTAGTQDRDPGSAATPEVTQPVEEGTYKTPTTDEAVWQEYSAADYVSEDVSVKPIAYQLTGHTEIDAGGPVPFDALLNLYEDGQSILTVYGRGVAYTYYGYWTNVEDENLWFCVAHYAITGQPGTCTIDYSYDLTGHFDELTVNVALGFADGGQFVREMPVGGDGSVQHPSTEQWLTDLGWTAPDPDANQPEESDGPATGDVLFSFTSDSENYLLDCYADGTYKFTFATAGLKETGTWAWKDWSFSLTDSNGKVTTAETDPDSHALKLHYVAAINEQVTRDFEADSSVWGPAFGGVGTYEPAGASGTSGEKSKLLFSFTSDSENYLLDCYADGTYKFTFATAGLEETGTWAWKDWSFSLTDSNGKVTTAETDPDSHALKLHYVAAINEQVTRDFEADSSVWGPAFNGEGTYSLEN